jgi:Asp-tRNA(Asn)/Glu-tRNA(Gln) amidotransferase A subunit family amidase
MPSDTNSASTAAASLVVNRRRLLQSLSAIGLGSWGFQRALVAQVTEQQTLTPAMISQAEWIAGIELSDEEREEVAEAVGQTLASARRLREVPIDADTVPALIFRPDFFYATAHAENAGDSVAHQGLHVGWALEQQPQALTDEELAFAPILTQASLLASGKISSRELTQLYLARLKQYDPLLKCVVTLLEETALQQADASDERRQHHGQTLGVLDGIPWVAKDLIAVPPHKTTWGAEPFREQVRPEMATVASRLEAAGTVLLAKVTLGALAWGDQWFGGMTRNPWNPEQGSSGSSAGSASAVAAGLASFALGSETLGSIVSPTRRCRTCGLRPTFGRVSRAGCMPLAWSMDKIGPIARHVDDLALIFPKLIGPDQKDPTLVERGFRWPIDRRLETLRVGLTGDRLNRTEQQAAEFLESQGASLIELDLTSELPVSAMNFILGVEATTVFDDAFRQDNQADYGLWPRTFRQAQFTPAVQYLRAQRLRGQLVTEAEKKLATVDVVLGADDLLLTNLTGHPSLVVACGSEKSREVAVPGVVKLTSAAYREELLLHVASILQAALPPVPSRPLLDEKL